MVDYVVEMTVEKSCNLCKYGKYEMLEHLLFLFFKCVDSVSCIHCLLQGDSLPYFMAELGRISEPVCKLVSACYLLFLYCWGKT